MLKEIYCVTYWILVYITHSQAQQFQFLNPIHFPYSPTGNPYVGVFLAIALPIDLRGPADLFISANFESSYALPSNQTELTYPPIYSLGREFIYKFLESKLNSHGYHGKYCLQRLICEAAEYTSINSGVLGDIVHVLLTPSSSSEDKKLLKYYTEPEEYGRKNGHCKKYSKKCPFSILNLFSSVKHLFNIKYPE